MTTTFEVHLAVYDLSRGMARSLSGQFLGPDHALDIIPHTGLVVYGKEYFFGGGIQCESPAIFRQYSGMTPISQQLLGHTSVSQDEFQEWCAQCMRMGRFTMESYDLLQQNCNNFSHEAALEGLRLPQGIPEWILDVPRRFLASPMGQLVRPMLEQMQVTGSNGGTAPFAAAGPPVSLTPAPVVVSNVNPWANLPSSTSSTAAASTSINNESSARQVNAKATPALDSYTQPLLSNDTKTASLCTKKLIATMEGESDDKAAFEDLSNKLTSGDKLPETLVEASSKALLKHLVAGENVTFALMLLRLVVLYPPKNVEESAFQECMDWVQQQLLAQNGNSSALSTPAARSMAWCVLSNAYGTSPTSTTSSLDTLVESAISDLSPDDSQSPVRQAAAAFLYNVSLVEAGSSTDEELPDVLVSLLCACLDGLALETDDTTKLRRLLVAAKICKPSASARALTNDLGFTDSLHEVITVSSGDATGDAAKVQQVTTEFICILES